MRGAAEVGVVPDTRALSMQLRDVMIDRARLRKRAVRRLRRLDRVDWQTVFAVETYGLHVGLRVDRADVFPQLLPALPPGWRPIPYSGVDRLYSLLAADGEGRQGPRPCYRLFVDARRVAAVPDLIAVNEVLEPSLQLYVAEHAPDRVFVHAGVVGWRGRAIVIPGRSYSGKSSLVAALLQAGATYYSDEFAVLDGQGRVHPYPRRLSLRQPEGRPSLRCRPDDFGACAGVEPLPLGLVVATRYRPGACWRPRSLSCGESALALLRNTVPVRRRPEAVLNVLEKVALAARALRGVRGEAADAAGAVLLAAARAGS